jgi:hypothetical protein
MLTRSLPAIPKTQSTTARLDPFLFQLGCLVQIFTRFPKYPYVSNLLCFPKCKATCCSMYLRPKLQWVCIGNSSKGRRENRERVKENTVPDVRKESTTKIAACFPGPSPSSSVLELECLTSSALSSTRPAQF